MELGKQDLKSEKYTGDLIFCSKYDTWSLGENGDIVEENKRIYLCV